MQLVPSTADLVRAEIADPAAFARQLGAHVPPDWPPEEAADALPWFLEQLEAAGPSGHGWYGFYGIVVKEHSDAPILVGGGGSLGPPEAGVVEIGYSVLPAFRRCGYATEMMSAVVEWLWRDARVRLIRAQTGNDNAASRAFLVGLGFTETQPGAEPHTMAFERFCSLRAPVDGARRPACSHRRAPQRCRARGSDRPPGGTPRIPA